MFTTIELRAYLYGAKGLCNRPAAAADYPDQSRTIIIIDFSSFSAVQTFSRSFDGYFLVGSGSFVIQAQILSQWSALWNYDMEYDYRISLSLSL